MSTIWPVVWRVSSNVETTRTASSVDYTHKTIPEFIELSLKTSMLTPVTAVIQAIPDPDFQEFHFPGITITTTEVPMEGDGSGGGETTTNTDIELVEMPVEPVDITIELISASEGVEEMISVNGDAITINVADSTHLFPFQRMEYKKDWKEQVKTNFYPWEISDDEYDVISAVEPSRNSTWVGMIHVKVSSSSSHNPTMKLVLVIENDFNYWVDEYVTPFMENSASFVEQLEEDGDIDDGSSIPPVMSVDNSEYVEITPELFDEDEFGNRVGTSLDEAIRKGENVDEAIDILSRTTEMGITIPRITAHKEDLLRTARTMLQNNDYKEPKDIIHDVFRFMQNDIATLPQLYDIEGAVRNRSIGFASELSRNIINSNKMSPNKIQSLRIHLNEIANGNYTQSLDILTEITTNININNNYIAQVESIKTKIDSGDTMSTISEITELLDGEPLLFDNLPNPDVTNAPTEPPTKVNPKRDSKDQLNTWLDKLQGKK